MIIKQLNQCHIRTLHQGEIEGDDWGRVSTNVFDRLPILFSLVFQPEHSPLAFSFAIPHCKIILAILVLNIRLQK